MISQHFESEEAERLWLEMHKRNAELWLEVREQRALIDKLLERTDSSPPGTIEATSSRGKIRGPAWAVILLAAIVAITYVALLLARFPLASLLGR